MARKAKSVASPHKCFATADRRADDGSIPWLAGPAAARPPAAEVGRGTATFGKMDASGAGGVEAGTALLAARAWASVVDASRLDESILDMPILDASRLDETKVDASRLVASRVDATKVDASTVDASHLDASTMETAPTGGARGALAAGAVPESRGGSRPISSGSRHICRCRRSILIRRTTAPRPAMCVSRQPRGFIRSKRSTRRAAGAGLAWTTAADRPPLPAPSSRSTSGAPPGELRSCNLRAMAAFCVPCFDRLS
eukprot:scaffold7847_cov135-Isochrysis_galbana.AAC.2